MLQTLNYLLKMMLAENSPPRENIKTVFSVPNCSLLSTTINSAGYDVRELAVQYVIFFVDSFHMTLTWQNSTPKELIELLR